MGINWKGKTGALLAALMGIVYALVGPEGSVELQERIGGLAIAFGGLSVYGIREAVGKLTIAGKVGPLLIAVAGLVKVLLPDQGAVIDMVLNAVLSIGAGMGLWSVRSATTRTT